MTQKDMINKIAEDYEMTKVDAKSALNVVIESIFNTLASGEQVKLNGFGTFSIVERAAREIRNPSNGELMRIPVTKSVKFKPGSSLKEAVKQVH
jgi:DNA-binding protein HU-beta